VVETFILNRSVSAIGFVLLLFVPGMAWGGEEGSGGQKRAAIGDALEKDSISKALKGDFSAARRAAQECLDVRTKQLGADHWQVKTARSVVEFVDRMSDAPAETRRELLQLVQRKSPLSKEGKHTEAAAVGEQICAIYERIVGKDSPHYADTLLSLGISLARSRKHQEAARCFTDALEVFAKVYGPEHPRCADTMYLQGGLRELRKESAEAEALFRRAMETQESAFGKGSSEWSRSAKSLVRVLEKRAQVSEEAKDVAAARATRAEVAALKTELLDEDPADGAGGQTVRRLHLVTQLGHSGRVDAVACSPDGRQLLTASEGTARLWEVASGREIRKFEGHSKKISAVQSVAFSPDGRRVLLGGGDAWLWDAATGKLIQRFEGHKGRFFGIQSVAFSPDGRRVLTGSGDKTARLWDAGTGEEMRKFEGHTSSVNCVAFSPEGRWVLTGSHDKTARLWDAGTGEETRKFEGHTSSVSCVAFSPDGQWVLTGGGDARLWDVGTGEEIRQFLAHGASVLSVAFSPTGNRILTGDSDRAARLWDTGTGKELVRLEGARAGVNSVAFSPDCTQLAIGTDSKTAFLWDTRIGNEVRRLEGHTSSVECVGFLQGGRQLLTGSRDRTARLWDTRNGKELRRLEGHGAGLCSIAICSDGRYALTGGWDGTARLWDTATGKEVRRFQGEAGLGQVIALSRDGTQLVGLTTGRMIDPDERITIAHLWEFSTGKEIQRFRGHDFAALTVAFYPDGRHLLIGNLLDLQLWDAATGKQIGRAKLPRTATYSVGFSLDGRLILTGNGDNTARLLDARSGKEVLRLEGHSSSVQSASFSQDGQWVLTGSDDGTSRLWDAAAGRELCRLIGFRDGKWAVVDTEGRYDASNGGDVRWLHWVVGNEPIELKQLKDRYYEPGLLAKIMGFNREPLRSVEAFRDPKLYPKVELVAPTQANPRLGVRLKNRGGGIGRVVVLINGKELTADARTPSADADAPELSLEVDLSDDPRLIPGESNILEVYAYNAEGYLRSRGYRVAYAPPGRPPAVKPHLWAIVVGVSGYRGKTIDLRYAAKDAEDLATALSTGASRLFGPERVRVALLTTESDVASQQPSRENLVREFTIVRERAKPRDVLVIYLAGHGVNFGGQDGDYYFLTSEATTSNLTDPEVRRQTAVSSQELTEWIKQIPALKQVMILDTCASGRLVDKITEKREVASSQIRAIERMKDRTGLHILAGCAANQASYEASQYAQGLLTYSLLLGIKGAALRENEFVDVVKLLAFSSDKVPELARNIGGIQRPLIAMPQGGASFDIGQLTTEDKARIPLQSVRHLILRTSFQDQLRIQDHLGLGKAVDQRLREVSARGREGRLVFVDAAELPGACQLAGRYRIDGDKITVAVVVVRDGRELGQFEVVGSTKELSRLTDEIVRRAGAQLQD